MLTKWHVVMWNLTGHQGNDVTDIDVNGIEMDTSLTTSAPGMHRHVPRPRMPSQLYALSCRQQCIVMSSAVHHM